LCFWKVTSQLILDEDGILSVNGWLRIKRLSRIAISAIMAVPKKKTSKSKRDKRRATWRHKATVQAQKALSLGKSILTGRSTFVYPVAEDEEEES
jgi:large subunit ribosomal protein L32